VGAVGGRSGYLSYAILAEYFPKELAGRANGALTLFHFGGAFVLQYAIGLVLQQWTSRDGPLSGDRLSSRIRHRFKSAGRRPGLVRASPGSKTWIDACCRDTSAVFAAKMTSYLTHPTSKHSGFGSGLRDSARVQATNWRLAALGSTGLSALLALTLAIACRARQRHTLHHRG